MLRLREAAEPAIKQSQAGTWLLSDKRAFLLFLLGAGRAYVAQATRQPTDGRRWKPSEL